MAASSALSLNLSNPISSSHPSSSYLHSPSFLHQHHTRRRRRRTTLQLPPSVASQHHLHPINVDYLTQEFGNHGVKFQTLEETSCVGKMRLKNGSSATFLLPHGLITSYKPKMWHGGTVELIQTSVGGQNGDGGAVIRGGVSLAFKFLGCGNGPAASWSPSSWSVADVRGDPGDCIEVELVSTGEVEQMLDIRYTMTMEKDMLSSELRVTNLNQSSPVQMTGSILSHLTVSTPEATTACGLDRSNFSSRRMLRSDFAIVPPRIDEEPSWGGNQKVAEEEEEEEEEEMEEGEESDSHKPLGDQMCRVYTCAPRNFTLIDRGRRNSVVIGREGFDELYMYSPGSGHESYGRYSYIAVGQSALLKPVILSPGKLWRGRQSLYNPNL